VWDVGPWNIRDDDWNLWDRIGQRNWLPHAYVSGTLGRIAPYCRGYGPQ
jgi:hypothetical protein